MKVTEKFFEFEGIKYYRKRALDIELGNVGAKRTKYIERDDTLDISDEVIDDNSFSFEYGKKSSVNFGTGVDLDMIPVLTPNGKFSLKVANDNSASVSLVKLSLDDDDIEDAFENDDRARRNMKSSSRMRVVNEIFVIVSADITSSRQVDFDIEAEANVRGVGIDLNLETSSGRTSRIKVDEGGTFAYMLARERSRSRRNRNRVTQLRNDAYGIG